MKQKIDDLEEAVFGLKELEKMVQKNRYNFSIPIMSVFDVERLKLATILLEEYLYECKESKTN